MELYQKYRTVTLSILTTIELLLANKTLTENNKHMWLPVVIQATEVPNKIIDIILWKHKHYVYTTDLLKVFPLHKQIKRKRGVPTIVRLTDLEMINKLISLLILKVIGLEPYNDIAQLKRIIAEFHKDLTKQQQ